MTDHHLMRLKDITMILGMIGIISYLFTLSSHIVHWDDSVNKLAIVEVQTAVNTTAIAVLNAQYFEINKKLELIRQQTSANE